jgi:hypothetical protein
MDKTKAKLAAENFRGTFADLSAIIEASMRPLDAPSNINRSIMRSQVKDIMTGAIVDKNPADQVCIWTEDFQSNARGMKRTKYAAIVQNIFREFA